MSNALYVSQGYSSSCGRIQVPGQGEVAGDVWRGPPSCAGTLYLPDKKFSSFYLQKPPHHIHLSQSLPQVLPVFDAIFSPKAAVLWPL